MDQQNPGSQPVGFDPLQILNHIRQISDYNEAISGLTQFLSMIPPGHDLELLVHDCYLTLRQRPASTPSTDEPLASNNIPADSASNLQARPDFNPALARLGVSFLQRFQNRCQPDDADRAVNCFKELASNLPDSHTHKPAILVNLASSLMGRFESRGEINDLDEAISWQELMIALTAPDDPRLPGRLFNYGNALRLRFDNRHDREDIEKTISNHQQAVLLTPDGHPNKPMFLNDLGVSLVRRFGESRDPSDVTLAISNQQQALSLVADGDPYKPRILDRLGGSFLRRFDLLGDPSDLNDAMRYREQAVLLTPDGHPDKPMSLINLGGTLRARFERQGELSDIDRAILNQEQAIALVSDSHPEKSMMLNDLGRSLVSRFERLGNLKDINKAVENFDRAVSLIPDGHDDRPARLENLGVALTKRFESAGNLADIDRAVSTIGQAIVLTQEGDPNEARLFSNVGVSLMRRFGRLGKIEDIKRAIENHNRAVHLTPQGHRDRVLRLNHLGTSIILRFLRLGDLDDINEAVSSYEEVVSLTPDGSPDKPAWLNNLGGAYNHRFLRLGQLIDGDRAISSQGQAVLLTPDDHPTKPTWLGNLGSSLLDRYERLGDVADINRATLCSRQALDLTPDGHSARPSRLTNLGNVLRVRFNHFHEVSDLEMAISSHEQAVSLTPNDHSGKPSRLNNLGNSLVRRYLWQEDIADLQAGISCYEQGIALSPDGRPDLLVNLGEALRHRFLRLDKIIDIDNSIAAYERAAALASDNDQIQSLSLLGLSRSLQYRYRSQHDVSDLNQQISTFMKAATSSVASPVTRFNATAELASVLSQVKRPNESLGAYKQAMNLVPSLVWLGQTVKRRYEALTPIANVAPEAIAMAFETGNFDLALEWLEQGRAIVWSQILQLRTPVDALHDIDPVLAARLHEVAHALDHSGTERPEDSTFESQVSAEATSQANHRLAEEWDVLLGRARLIPQFKDPTRRHTMGELMNATHSGCVVIINVHAKRCDALVLRQNSNMIFDVPLSSFSYNKAAKMRNIWSQSLFKINVRERGFKNKMAQPMNPQLQFQDVLASLWKDVVRPVLAHLEYLRHPPDDTLPHITWCTTGPLSFLPLHAAGIYDGIGPQPKIFHYVVSSYTPTLAALLVTPPNQDNFRGILAVGQEATRGHAPLPGTVEELNRIQQIAVDLRFTRLEGGRATVSAVIDGMAGHSWVHLACHASQNRDDPTASAFYLHDGSLDLSTISKSSLNCASLAFLSACQTAAGDEGLPEEVIHLAAGMLMSGYPSVIATMWSIQDEHAPLIAERFYKGILKEDSAEKNRAARALHDAVATLRTKVGEDKFETWVPYIHLGL